MVRHSRDGGTSNGALDLDVEDLDLDLIFGLALPDIIT
jgi:hypothetical protein